MRRTADENHAPASSWVARSVSPHAGLRSTAMGMCSTDSYLHTRRSSPFALDLKRIDVKSLRLDVEPVHLDFHAASVVLLVPPAQSPAGPEDLRIETQLVLDLPAVRGHRPECHRPRRRLEGHGPR